MLAAVADGVGGEAGGEQASAAALAALDAAWRAWRPSVPPSPMDLERVLHEAGAAADQAVRLLAGSRPELHGAATTLTAAVLAEGQVTLLHGGDSRAYRVQSGGGHQLLTRDHTWVAAEIAAGRLTEAEAVRHAMRNVITQYLGKEDGCDFEVAGYRLEPGEGVLLCTDGLSNVVALSEGAPSNGHTGLPAARPSDTASRLLREVERLQGGDDATVVVLLPRTAATDPFGLRRGAPQPRASRRPLVIAAGGIAATVALGVAGVSGWRTIRGYTTKYAPARDAERYLTAWQNGDFNAMYSLLSGDAQRSLDRAAFVGRHEAVAAEMTLSSIDVRLRGMATQPEQGIPLLANEAREPFEVLYRTARFGEIRRQGELPLVWSGGRWSVDWSPAVLLPELTGGRLVRAFSDPAPRGSILDRAGRPLAVTSIAAGPQPTGVVRAYPQGTTAGPLAGYVGQVGGDELKTLAPKGYLAGDVTGRAGIEAAAETLLAGQRGGRLTVIQPTGDVFQTLSAVPPRAGVTVLLSIDLEIQRAAEEALGERPGSAIVLDPRTGALRALATSPRYDPSVFATGGDVNGVLNNPGQPLLVRPLQGQYPPGSTFKVITMAAALESGAFTPASEFTCSGRWTGLPGLTFDCWLRTGHGRQDLVSGLTHSCNSVFYELGKRLDEMDATFLPSFAQRCGVGAVTGGAPGIEAAGIAPSPDWKRQTQRDGWARGDAVNMAIGQGQLLMTPLQMAAVYASIATSGQGPGLRLLDRVLLPGGSVERTLPGATPREPWKSSTYEAIRAGLRNVIGAADGTAAFVFQGSPLAAIASGKTGTAESGGGRQSHAWFACYAPFDAPRAVVLVMLENGGEGSSAAAPVARRILEAVLDRM